MVKKLPISKLFLQSFKNNYAFKINNVHSHTKNLWLNFYDMFCQKKAQWTVWKILGKSISRSDKVIDFPQMVTKKEKRTAFLWEKVWQIFIHWKKGARDDVNICWR